MIRVSLFFVLAFVAAAYAEEITPVADLLAQHVRFDGKFACVQGKTSVLFKKAASRQGNPYFTFWIGEGASKIKVFGFGVPKVFAEGDEVEACGRFDKEKHISSRVFYDELSANVILKGAAMRSGLVDISGGRFAVKGASAHPGLVQLTTNLLKPAAPAKAPPAR